MNMWVRIPDTSLFIFFFIENNLSYLFGVNSIDLQFLSYDDMLKNTTVPINQADTNSVIACAAFYYD